MRRFYMVFILVMLIATPVVAQQSEGHGQEVSGESITDSQVGQISSVNVGKLIRTFLKRHGLRRGSNKGGKLYVTTGVASILARPGSHGYINSRSIAYDKALYTAKRKLIQKVEQDIRTGLISSVTSMSVRNPEDFESTKKKEKPELLDKAIRLVHAKLDNLLKKEGVDLDSEQGKVKAKQLLASSEFKKITASTAEGQVYGVQAIATFESGGKIGVVAIFSEKSRAMATDLYNALSGKATLRRRKPHKPIEEYIPKEEATLLTTFGVKQVIDENGYVWLLSFGQAGLRGNFRGAEDVALDEAEIESEGCIRQFAGEVMTISRIGEKSEKTAKFVGKPQVVGDFSTYQKTIKAKGESLKISGIEEVDSMIVKHPGTGQPVAIYITKWSPLSAAEGNSLKKLLGDGPKHIQPRNTGETPSDVPTGGDLGGNTGMTVDEDAW